MAVSEFYSDDELISQLRMFFDEDIDYKACLSQVTEVDDSTFEVKVKGRVFRFDKVLCGVEEVKT